MTHQTGSLASDDVRGMFDRIAPVYDVMNRVMTAGLDRSWRRLTVEAVVQPGDRVLDACCGTGDLGLAAEREGGIVTGLDFSARMLERARRKSDSILWVEGDLLALPFDDASFDTATVGFGVRNVSDLEAALAELHRVLRPGGELLLTLDNLANPVVALRNALPFGPLNALGIVPHRVGATSTPRQLTALLRAAHFDVREIGAILHCPRVLAVAGAAVVNRLGSARAQQRYLRWLLPFEHLASLPTRYLTGYFIAVVAHKP